MPEKEAKTTVDFQVTVSNVKERLRQKGYSEEEIEKFSEIFL